MSEIECHRLVFVLDSGATTQADVAYMAQVDSVYHQFSMLKNTDETIFIKGYQGGSTVVRASSIDSIVAIVMMKAPQIHPDLGQAA
jgi:hypothetical protein